MRLQSLGRLALLVFTSVLLYTSQSVQAQVGWCAASSGNVFRVGFNSLFQQVFPYQITGNWAWYDGGTNDATACYTGMSQSIKQCGNWCNGGNDGTDAQEICASDPSIIQVESVMYSVYWNPNGRQAYLNNDGNTQALGYVDEITYCCPQFHINC